MAKYIWASRHEMTPEQVAALGTGAEIVWFDTSSYSSDSSSYELDELVACSHLNEADALAVVLPVPMLQELLSKTQLPVLRAKTRREFNEDGSKKEFVFDGWEQVVEVRVVTRDFDPAQMS